MNEQSFDALLPQSMAEKAEAVGVAKAQLPAFQMFMLAVLAGAFIALGAIFATVVWTGVNGAPWGWWRVAGGLVFSLGLILVIVGGAELFTGNNLIVMAWAGRKVSSTSMLRNWAIVYAGNFVGSIGTVALVYMSRHWTMAGGEVGKTALGIAHAKLQYGFAQAVALGILCNALVCLAVWLAFSARSTVDKIAAIVFPITAFVACGFEHSVANMYFVPMGLVIKSGGSGVYGDVLTQYDGLTWSSFFIDNLLPVTIGNIIGGTVLVGGVYWVVYLRRRP